MGKRSEDLEKYNNQLMKVYKQNEKYIGKPCVTREEMLESFQGYLQGDKIAGYDAYDLIGQELNSTETYGGLTSKEYMESYSCGLPMLLGKNDKGEPYIVNFAEHSSGIISGDSGRGKTWMGMLMVMNLILTNDYNNKQFIILDDENLWSWWIMRKFPHVMGYHTEYENYLGVMREVGKEIDRRKGLLNETGEETYGLLRKRLLEEGKHNELKKYPELTIIMNGMRGIMGDLKLHYEDDVALFEEFRALYVKITQEGRKYGVRAIVISSRTVDDAVPVEALRNSTLKIVYNHSVDTDYGKYYGLDYGGDEIISKGRFLTVNRNRDEKFYKGYVLGSGYEHILALLKVAAKDWVRRSIGADDLIKQPIGMDLGVAYNRDEQVRESLLGIGSVGERRN